MSLAFKQHPLASGAYTLPDAARLLEVPLGRIRAWVRGTAEASAPRHLPAGPFASRAEGRDRHVDFYTLIELFTVAELRRLGVSMKIIRLWPQISALARETAKPFGYYIEHDSTKIKPI